MIRMIAIAGAALMLGTAMPVAPAAAQEGTIAGAIFGGVAGAAVGGAIGGGRGAAIGAGVGAATGAVIGSQHDARARGVGYFWHQGRCWYRYPNGQVVRVSRDYCY